MPYNYTNLTNSTDPYELAKFTNDASGGDMSIILIVSVFVVTFIATRRYGTKTAVAGSALLASVSIMFLRLLGWVGDVHLYAGIMLMVGAFVFAVVYKDTSY